MEAAIIAVAGSAVPKMSSATTVALRVSELLTQEQRAEYYSPFAFPITYIVLIFRKAMTPSLCQSQSRDAAIGGRHGDSQNTGTHGHQRAQPLSFVDCNRPDDIPWKERKDDVHHTGEN
jgi:hypothetical protein